MVCGQNGYGVSASHYAKCKDEDDTGVEVTCKENYKSCKKYINGKYSET